MQFYYKKSSNEKKKWPFIQFNGKKDFRLIAFKYGFNE